MSATWTALVWAGAVVVATAIISCAFLRAWQLWIELRRQEVGHRPLGGEPDHAPGPRIEVADLKERLRKLEAIARGVDL